MSDELKKISTEAENGMKKAINHLEIELSKIRAGKASPSILEGVNVDYYGTPTPISQIANVQVLDARTISIQPWEKSMLQAIEKAIQIANLGLNPMNNGDIIMINVPPLTEERRIGLAKQSKAEAEHAKVGVRNARKDANNDLKKLDDISIEFYGSSSRVSAKTLFKNSNNSRYSHSYTAHSSLSFPYFHSCCCSHCVRGSSHSNS